jgi:uncharacterized protein YlxW (UPF0749 family)
MSIILRCRICGDETDRLRAEIARLQAHRKTLEEEVERLRAVAESRRLEAWGG